MSEDSVLLHQFSRGDLVRIERPGSLNHGLVGEITRYAHPASPWTWVVFSLPGCRPVWSEAVNEDEISRAEAT